MRCRLAIVLSVFSLAIHGFSQTDAKQESFAGIFPIPQQGSPHNGQKNAAYTVEELCSLDPLPEQAWMIGQIKDITAAGGGNGTEAIVYFVPNLKVIVDLSPVYQRMGVVDGSQTKTTNEAPFRVGGISGSMSGTVNKTTTVKKDAKTIGTREGVMLTSVEGIKTRNLGDIKKGGTLLVGLNIKRVADRVVCSGIFGSYKAPPSIGDQQKPVVSPLGIPVPKK